MVVMNICDSPGKNPFLHCLVTNLQALRIPGHRLWPELISGGPQVTGGWLQIINGGLHSQPAPRSTCPIADSLLILTILVPRPLYPFLRTGEANSPPVHSPGWLPPSLISSHSVDLLNVHFPTPGTTLRSGVPGTRGILPK